MGVLGYPRTGTASTLSENLGDHRRQRLAPDRRFFRLAITRSCWASGRRSAVSAWRFQRDANAWACSTDGGAAGLSHPDWGPRCGRSAARCGRGWMKSWTAGWWSFLTDCDLQRLRDVLG